MAQYIEQGKRFQLNSPSLAPNSAAYLWNRKMMLHMNCRGYAVSQYMDPEPRKYAHVPTLAAVSFMQPEQPYFAHHPGRFFYIRDNQSGEMFSAPYAPMNRELDLFSFEPGTSDIRWKVQCLGLELIISLGLSDTDVVERWSVDLINLGESERDISLIPYFPVGYSSWMNMGGSFDPELNAILCTCITPYQKVDDYFKNAHLKDMTYLCADRKVDFFEVSQPVFEGEGGLHAPSSLANRANLGCGDAIYEMPTCCMQFCIKLQAYESQNTQLIFGPAKDAAEVARMRKRYLLSDTQQRNLEYKQYVERGKGCLEIESPDSDFDSFVNHWLPRQVYYHGDSNRLSTDPQTRNYLQDAMGMAYVDDGLTKTAILTALAQQKDDGEMPDGILLSAEAELKYINQVPHTDHSVWLCIIMTSYLNETGDSSLLEHQLKWSNNDVSDSVFEHISRAMNYLIGAVDERGLPYIAQGDWCDPMNMVGYQGKGVSAWLTEAISYALQLWADICEQHQRDDLAVYYQEQAGIFNQRLNQHFWHNNWFGRGITDAGTLFGIDSDPEGKIFLNAQSWALLCKATNTEQQQQILAAIDERLETPYGVMMFAPAFTAMRDDIGRVTQKWPGSAENGSVYNHAAAFYAASLFAIDEPDRAFSTLRRMLSSCNETDIKRRDQLPVYIPNYYRGAYYQHPRTAGRSSNLFNTGSGAWFYQLTIEKMFGLQGCKDGLLIKPQLPSHWSQAKAKREFRGAEFSVTYQRSADINAMQVFVNDEHLDMPCIQNIERGMRYKVLVKLPLSSLVTETQDG
ncbi:glycosyltransferase 36 [Alginatibacterium sediminis]|uniref:Glycosyltransferase 36 n=1 Tax=Alginatibacterium sediminis TaxID=2164068 RepID=A0A420EDA0_9ALTE|nr:glycosyltransferase 36 [Alginatibacterium sediminis]RKF18641.1 glycosyltransferase 36 [Alginatibacterium sediminis]